MLSLGANQRYVLPPLAPRVVESITFGAVIEMFAQRHPCPRLREHGSFCWNSSGVFEDLGTYASYLREIDEWFFWWD